MNKISARYLRNTNFEDSSRAIESRCIKLDYCDKMVKSFLDVCYGVNTKLNTIDLVQLLDLCIYLQADRVAKAVGANLMQIAEKNGRLWTSILFAFGHLDDPAINQFFSSKAAQNQLKQGAYRSVEVTHIL